MVDYGIVSLLILQLAALVGSAAAYVRMRTQAERVSMQRDLSASRCEDLERRYVACQQAHAALAEEMAEQRRRNTHVLEAAGEAHKIARRAEERAEQAHTAAVSARNAAAALKRHNAAKPVDADPEDEAVFPEGPPPVPYSTGPRPGDLPAGFGSVPK